MAKTKKYEITTKSGFTWPVDPKCADDAELIDQILLMVQGKPGWVMAEIAEGLLGADGKKAIYEHCRENGRVSWNKLAPEIDEIYGLVSELKKE